MLTWIKLCPRRSRHAAAHKKVLCQPQPPDSDGALKSTPRRSKGQASGLGRPKTLDRAGEFSNNCASHSQVSP